MSRIQKLAAEYANDVPIEGDRARFLLHKGFLAGYAACEQDAKVMEEALEEIENFTHRVGPTITVKKAQMALAKWKERGE